MKIFQKGFNFSQDGPGNRLVYHLQGCNMKCIWCSNPEGMDFSEGDDVLVEDILSECVRSKMMFFGSGGVTFTGGEATIQHDELFMLLKMLKRENIHTAIETNGTSKKLQLLLQYIDYLIMDFKHYDSEKLKEYTGMGNEEIKKNFELNCLNKRQQHIRIPLINNFNTDNPEKFAEYFSCFNTENTVFEILLYHEYGKNKWESEYKIKDGFVAQKTLDNFNKIFKEYNLKIINT